jgi:recombination protein RecA
VDIDRVLLIEPSTGEEAVDQFDAVIRAQETCFIGLDSVAMVTPFKEIDSSAEDNQIGLQARLIGKMLRRANNAVLQERRNEHHPTICLLNQFRMKAGLVFGDPRTLPGGKALEFATSQQVELKNKEARDKDGIVIFNEHSFTITKDKTGGRLKEGKFKLVRDESQNAPVGYIDQAASIIEFGEKAGLVSGRYEIDGFKHKFRGKDDLKAYLIEHPAEEALICHKIVQVYRKRWGVDV